ncbi:MAG: arginase family protein [bacterium]|nr:arginase family protein [bacterium]
MTAPPDRMRTIPVATFFGARTGTLQDLTSNHVAMTGLHCDHFGGRPPAARFAARQIRYCGTELHSSVGRNLRREHLVDIDDLKVFPLEPVRTEDVISEQCARVIDTGARLLILGGDYSLAPALLGGALRAQPGASYGLLRLSSNMDLQSFDGERTNLPERRITTSRIASMLAGGVHDVALLGVRGLVTTEESNCAAGTLLVTAGQLRGDGRSRIIDRLLCWANGFSAIFLSIDADVLAGAAVEQATLPESPGLPAETVVCVLRSLHNLAIPIAHLAGHRPDFDLTGRSATEAVAAIGLELIEAMLPGHGPCR